MQCDDHLMRISSFTCDERTSMAVPGYVPNVRASCFRDLVLCVLLVEASETIQCLQLTYERLISTKLTSISSSKIFILFFRSKSSFSMRASEENLLVGPAERLSLAPKFWNRRNIAYILWSGKICWITIIVYTRCERLSCVMVEVRKIQMFFGR